jgi:hypothetical protein
VEWERQYSINYLTLAVDAKGRLQIDGYLSNPRQGNCFIRSDDSLLPEGSQWRWQSHGHTCTLKIERAGADLRANIPDRCDVCFIEFAISTNILRNHESIGDDSGVDITGLRSESGLNTTVLDKINDVLVKNLNDAGGQGFDCQDETIVQSVNALSKNYLTMRIEDDGYCGGAHSFSITPAFIFLICAQASLWTSINGSIARLS